MAINTNTKKTNPFQNIVDEVDNEVEKVSSAPKKNIAQASADSMLQRDLIQRTLAQIYSAQKKFAVRIAPSYAKHFGRIMRVTINGVCVAVPCNGQVFNIPAEFACECERRMREIDSYELKTRKMADIKNNYEPDIGQLSFF